MDVPIGPLGSTTPEQKEAIARAFDSMELHGATEPGPANCYPSTPGEFAARWNSLDEEQRAGWLRAMQRADEVAVRCRMMHQRLRQHGSIDQLLRDVDFDGYSGHGIVDSPGHD